MRPKCGRMVAFSNGNIRNAHFVRGIKSGRRCALPLWFTLQGDKIEDNRGKYLNILKNVRKEKNELEGMEPLGMEKEIKQKVLETLEGESGNGVKSEL